MDSVEASPGRIDHHFVDESCGVDERWPVLIRLLGPFRVLKRGRLVVLRNSGKTEALLFHLAVRRGYRASRVTLLEKLWPDSEHALAGQCLNALVHSLHKLLGDALGGAAPVLQSGGYCRLNVEAGVGVDVACFDTLARDGEGHARSGHLAAAILTYRSAVSLYDGDLGAGSDVQAIIERERIRALYLTLLARLAEMYYAGGDYDSSLRAALDVLHSDPCREDAHRLAMRCYVKRGERAQALRQYELCETILRSEFDAMPEPITATLFEQVRLTPHTI